MLFQMNNPKVANRNPLPFCQHLNLYINKKKLLDQDSNLEPSG